MKMRCTWREPVRVGEDKIKRGRHREKTRMDSEYDDEVNDTAWRQTSSAAEPAHTGAWEGAYLTLQTRARSEHQAKQ